MRRIWRVCKWILLLLFCAAAGVLLLNAFDEPLKPEVTALLQDQGEPLTRQQNMYYALMGFSAAAPDMEEAGWNQVQVIDAALRAGKSWIEADEQAELPRRVFVGDRTHLPGYGQKPGELQGILDFLRLHKQEAEQLLVDNRVILDRYAALDHYPHFAITVPPNILMIGELPWDGIGPARRLWKLEVVGLVADGHMDDAIDWLQRDTRFWRRLLSERRIGLMGKSIVAYQVASNFHLASEIVHAYALNGEQLTALRGLATPLTVEERSVAAAFKDEFLEKPQSLSLFDDSAEYAKLFGGSKLRQLDVRLLVFVQKRFYLRNATLNLFYRKMQQSIDMDNHACRSFQTDEQSYAEEPKLSLGMLRNPVGKMIADIPGPYHHSYTGKMCDLQGFQRMLALQLLLREHNVADDQVATFIRDAGADYTDPFTGAPMQWLPQLRSLSFDAVNERNQKMLPWPI